MKGSIVEYQGVDIPDWAERWITTSQSIHTCNILGDTILHTAIKQRCPIFCFENLILLGASLQKGDERGRTALDLIDIVYYECLCKPSRYKHPEKQHLEGIRDTLSRAWVAHMRCAETARAVWACLKLRMRQCKDVSNLISREIWRTRNCKGWNRQNRG